MIHDAKGALSEQLMGDHCGCAVCYQASQEIERLRAVVDGLYEATDRGDTLTLDNLTHRPNYYVKGHPLKPYEEQLYRLTAEAREAFDARR